MRKIIRDKAVGTAAVAGLIVAAMAMIGAGRYPGAFIAVGAVWLVVTAAAVAHAARRAD